MNELIEIWTDGACSGNPGPGGWAAILRWRDHEKELSGAEPHTTNNRMELMSVLKGLSALTRPSCVAIVTDSAYVEKAFTQGWIAKWQQNVGRHLPKSLSRIRICGRRS